WTEAEIQQAIVLDYQPVSLGKRILRTVTAPTAALALVAALWESDNPFTVKDESGQNADQ
ncbi:MAG: 16S rRNA (uracil(1498)-N(3))-methyltransferase, partial [Microcystaceae cyanobacterium]